MSVQVATRLNRAAATKLWRERMTKAFPSTPSPAYLAGPAGDTLRRAWNYSAWGSTAPRHYDPKEIHRRLKLPLPVRERINETYDATPTPRRRGVQGLPQNTLGPMDIDVPAAFMPISWSSWEAELNVWEANGRNGRGPLTPEQRDVSRAAFRASAYRIQSLKSGVSPDIIADQLKLARVPSVILLVGPGGTGKSQTIEQLGCELESARVGYVLITAYTGVAAAAFGAPTLLKLLGFGYRRTVTLAPCDAGVRMQKMKKFVEESGIAWDDVACIVIDEVSFLDVALLGRSCHAFSILAGVEQIPVGGVPIILAGDCQQKDPCGSDPFYKALVKEAEAGGGRTQSNPTSPDARGMRLLRLAKRFDLKKNMRAKTDQAFVAYQTRMRDTAHLQPVSPVFVNSVLGRLSRADIDRDPRWLLAPMGILTHIERDHLNVAGLKLWCQIFKVPFVRWKVALESPEVLGGIPQGQLHREELNLFGYYGHGAPALLNENTQSTRGLVNSAAVLLYDLYFSAGKPEALERAERSGVYQEVTLEDGERPDAIIVRVGNSTSQNFKWHGIKLPNLRDKLVNFEDADEGIAPDGDQLAPILISKQVRELELTGTAAARHGLPKKLMGRAFALNLAFALTDYKLQGRTLELLLLNLPNRSFGPYMTLKAFYVLVSRATKSSGLRLLEADKEALAKLLLLRHDVYLAAWERGYDDDGLWNDNLARKALAEMRKTRGKAKPDTNNDKNSKRKRTEEPAEVPTQKRKRLARRR